MQSHHNSKAPMLKKGWGGDPWEEVHLIKTIPYILVLSTTNEKGLAYIKNSICGKRFTMSPNKSLQTTGVLSETWYLGGKY